METTATNKTTYPQHKNKVMDSYRLSANFYHSDKILRNYLKHNASKEGQAYMQDKLEYTGAQAAGVMNSLSLLADKKGPELHKRNFTGENIDEIRFHPAYWDLIKIAVKSEMFRVKWEPALQQKFNAEKQRLGFASGYLYAMSESGQFCPLCMTDGVARLIDLFCREEDRARLLPHIATSNAEELFTGAMFLTEKTGGSDVGASITVAEHVEDDVYLLNGEKWFCSNANAQLIFALARTDNDVKGTRGLSIFLIENPLQNGERNYMEVIRLKDKLGVRSMASAECILRNTRGKLVGKEFEGFKVMIEMVNLSRLYNSVAALSAARRALIEAYQFLNGRITFGKPALEHALIRTKLTELAALNVANFYLVWRAIEALDKSDNGDKKEAQLFRIINPITKKWSAETGVYITRESMELMGGLGYIEDGVMPKIMRDVMVLPIWEGSGNIIVLDILRAFFKSEGFDTLSAEVENSAAKSTAHGEFLLSSLQQLKAFAQQLKQMEQPEMEASAKPFFERLTSLYQISVLIDNLNDESATWINPSITYLKDKYTANGLSAVKPLSVEEVRNMVAWEI